MNDILNLATSSKHIRMVWKNINEGMVYNECFSQDYGTTSSVLHEVKKLSSMQDPILRYLSIQSYHLFESIQNMKEFDLENVVLKSREYRAILAECEEQIINEIRSMEDMDNCDEEKYAFVTSHCNFIKDYQMLWHLAEIFFIKLSSGGFLVQDLQGWLNLQQPYVSINYNNLMENYNNANGDIELELDSVYWPTVHSLAMHGRKSELINLLVCHTLSNGQAIRAVREVVTMLPVFDEECSKCPMEFDIVWKRWRKMAQNYLTDSCLLGPYPELVVLADILLGKEEILFSQRMIDLVDGCWYYAVVPHLLYSQPLANVKDVSQCYKKFKRGFQNAVNSFEEAATEVCSEQILQAINASFNLDLAEFICSISRNSNSWWLPAHLVDIIEKINPHLFPLALPPVCGTAILGDNISRDVSSMKEFFVLQYASGLTSHHSLTLMALNYMHYCPIMGHAQIEQVIDRLHFPTDRLATMMHSWCTKRQHHEIAASICKRQAVATFKRGRLGNSLAWSVKGNDANFISRIADKLLQDVLSSESTEACPLWLDMLDCIKNVNLGVCGKKMTFVIKFHEMQTLLREERYGDAAASLVQLLQSQLVSCHLNLAILMCARPLLEVRGVWKTEDLYVLMETLEDVRGGSVFEVDDLRRLLVGELSRACLL